MAWGTPTVGTMATGTGNPPSLSPGAPSGSGGVLLLLSALESSGSCATPSGWTVLVTGDSSRLMLYGRIADGSGSDTPTVSYSTSAAANAMAQIARISGGPTTLTGIVDASGSVYTASQTNTITVPTLTPTVDNCLCIFAGYHKADNGPTTARPFSSTALGEANTLSFHTTWAYEIQTTKTTRSGGSFSLTGSITEDTRSIVAALVSGAATTKYLKALAHSSAAGISSVAGSVFNAPDGSDISGSKIGEFSSMAFLGANSLDGGKAKLLVNVASFGGSSLTTANTPHVYLRTSSFDTPIFPATVVEV